MKALVPRRSAMIARRMRDESKDTSTRRYLKQLAQKVEVTKAVAASLE